MTQALQLTSLNRVMLKTINEDRSYNAGFGPWHTSSTPMNDTMRRCCSRDVAGVVSM